LKAPSLVRTIYSSEYVVEMTFVMVTVTVSVPEIVVVVGAQPKTEEQKLVRDAVLVFVLWIAFEHEEMDRTVHEGACAYAPSRIAATARKATLKAFILSSKG
jgi:hypothetical protein